MIKTLTSIIFLIATTSLSEQIHFENFSIDQTEVTVNSFEKYAESNGIFTQAEREGGGFEWAVGWERRAGWTYRSPQGLPAKANEPAVHITWAEANAFCAKSGGRLPTKKEWVSAAYTEQREGSLFEFEKGKTYQYPVGNSPEGMNYNSLHHLPVKVSKQGVNGLYDMGGNVWEWLADRQDNQALTAGGSWWYGPSKTKIDGLQWKPADFFAVYIGFRCVY